MEVYTRPDSPFWQADLYVAGKRRRVSLKPLTHAGKGATKASAAVVQAERLQTDLNEQAKAAPTVRTVRQALDDYVASLEGAGRVSAKNVAGLRDKCLGLSVTLRGRYCLDGDMALSALTSRDIENLVKARRAEGNGAQIIAHEIRLIRAATREAAALGYAVPLTMVNGSVKNPWRMPEIKGKTRYLSWEEFQRLYDYLSVEREVSAKTRTGGVAKPYLLEGLRVTQRQDAQDLLVALVMTGGRWSEVAALTWDRVDLRHGTIRLFGTKDGEERTVPLPEQFRLILRRRAEDRKDVQHLIFPGRHGDQRGGTCRAILRAMNECGLNRTDSVARYGKATVHSLRHTFASWLLQNGADLSEVQDMLGHATMQMTRRYAHLAKRATVAKLGSILSRVGTKNDSGEQDKGAAQD